MGVGGRVHALKAVRDESGEQAFSRARDIAQLDQAVTRRPTPR
jgi:hypothetical protein